MPKFASLLLIALAAACGSASATEPIASSTILGDFGGDQVLLHATATGADLQFSCMAVTVSRSLTTDASGHFTAIGGRRRTGGAISLVEAPPTPVRLDGHASIANGGTLDIIIADIPEEPGAPILWADTLTLVRDRKATIYLCP